MGESKTMKRIRVLHSELNGELGGIESFLSEWFDFCFACDKTDAEKILNW